MDLQEQYEKLLRYCYMLTKDRTLAEDIVQDAYIRFWRSHSYKDLGKEQAYLYVIARNLCMDEFRKQRTCGIDCIGDMPADRKFEPESRVDSIALEDALEQLPSDLRDLVVLRYVSEVSVVDISKIVGMSRFAVHRRLKEGLRLLRNELEGEKNE